MKKLFILIPLSLVFLLSGCIDTGGTNTTDQNVNTYTEAELQALIEELMPESQSYVDTTYDLASFESAVTSMVAEARNGVLGIYVTSSIGTGSGSGVIYKQEGNTYYIVTNNHVIYHDDSLGTIYPPLDISIVYERYGLLFEIDYANITLIGADATTDLAVLSFTSSEDFSVIPLADSYDLELGQFVFAIGNPLGFDYYGTVTMGVLSGLARYVEDGTFSATLIQHDAAISPGNSGGALLNTNGELIGINNMKIVEDGVSNIGFAIPSNTVKRIIEDLEDDGIITRPFLGISTYAQVNVCGTEYGVCLSSVAVGGGAEAAGLQADDTIIGYKAEGMTDYINIYNFNDLKEAILNSQVGDAVQILYIRSGVTYESDTAILGVHPDD